MTNDFSVEQKKPSVLPYAGLGAVAGGVTGYAGLPKWTGKPMTHEDLIKEIEDTATFSDKVKEGAQDADLWKEAEAKNKAVKDAEKALEEASKPKLPSGTSEAQIRDQVEKEAKEWIEAEQARVDKAAGNTGRRVKGFPTKEAVAKMELGEEERKVLYDYCDKYETARKNIFAKDGYVDLLINGDGTGSKPLGLKQAKKNLSDFYSTLPAHKKNAAIKDEYSKQIAAQVESFLPKSFNASSINSYEMLKECQAMYGDDLFSVTDSYVRGAKPLEVTPGKRVYVTVNESALKSKRNSFREQITDNISKYIEKDAELKGFDEKFLKENKAALELNLKTPITAVADVPSLTAKGKTARETLLKLDGLEHRIKSGEIKFPSSINVNGADIAIADQAALDTLKRENVYLRDIATQYTKEKAKIQVARDSVIRQDVRVTYRQKKIKNAVNNDEGVKKVLDSIEFLNRETASESEKALYRRLKSMINVEEASGSAERITEDKLPQALKDKLKAAREAYAKKAATEGKVDEAAKKAAEEKLGTVKNEFKEAAQKLIDKLPKKPGVKPIVGALIGAGAIGLAGWLIAPKKPKEA